MSNSTPTKEKKKRKKEEKKRKKDDDKRHEKKSKKKKRENTDDNSCSTSNRKDDVLASKKSTTNSIITPKIVASDAIPPHSPSISLLLFYQYIDPPLPPSQFPTLLNHCSSTGTAHKLTGRMRVANEGLNCTLTGSSSNLRSWIHDLVSSSSTFSSHFSQTEFKITDKLPPGQAFPTLHVFKVDEIVNYGLAGDRAPSMKHTGHHLEPSDYHDKLLSKDTVVIDVRNHYESSIGRFEPPPSGAKLIDPLMRKSTEFPLWLDKKETKDALRGKQVLMYCTGGVRCERASALLREKMATEDDVKELGIKGVYQLQGGIDKYFRDFPDGGLWRGKNYVFDKRFAHGPPGKISAAIVGKEEKEEAKIVGKEKKTIQMTTTTNNNNHDANDDHDDILGHCEACHKPWDKFRGKRRCPTCGVPSLICRDCFDQDKNGVKKLDKNVRCELCVKQNITSKKDYRQRERQEMMHYEAKLKQKQHHHQDENHHHHNHNNFNDNNDDNKLTTNTTTTPTKITPNPSKITRLFIKNLHRTRVTESTLLAHLPNITHIQWLRDKRTKKFYGSIFVEMATPDDAARAVSEWNGKELFGRRLTVIFQKADGKDLWPVPGTRVGSGGGGGGG